MFEQVKLTVFHYHLLSHSLQVMVQLFLGWVSVVTMVTLEPKVVHLKLVTLKLSLLVERVSLFYCFRVFLCRDFAVFESTLAGCNANLALNFLFMLSFDVFSLLISIRKS